MEENGALTLEMDVQFEDPMNIGFYNWDTVRPYRNCPRNNFQILKANASWRDTENCVIWPAQSPLLEVVMVSTLEPGSSSLVEIWKDWQKAGSPDVKPWAEEWKKTHSPHEGGH